GAWNTGRSPARLSPYAGSSRAGAPSQCKVALSRLAVWTRCPSAGAPTGAPIGRRGSVNETGPAPSRQVRAMEARRVHGARVHGAVSRLEPRRRQALVRSEERRVGKEGRSGGGHSRDEGQTEVR